MMTILAWVYIVGLIVSIIMLVHADRRGQLDVNVEWDGIELTRIGQIVLVALLWPIVVCCVRVRRKLDQDEDE